MNPLRSDLLPLSDCILAGRTIRASRRGAPQPPTMWRLSELRALFLFGGQPLPDQPWVGLEDSGVVSWIVETLRVGFRIPFDRRPPLSEWPLCLLEYSRQPIEIVALIQELQILLRKGAVEQPLSLRASTTVSSSSRRFRGRGTPSLTSHPERLCHLVSFYIETT